MAQETSGKWPGFFHIGAPRTATTTIQSVLGADPRISVFRSGFFNTPMWYLGRPGFQMNRERLNVISAETLVRKHEQRFKFIVTMERIARMAPKAHIILTIREQRAWLLSRYKYAGGGGNLSCSLQDFSGLQTALTC